MEKKEDTALRGIPFTKLCRKLCEFMKVLQSDPYQEDSYFPLKNYRRY